MAGPRVGRSRAVRRSRAKAWGRRGGWVGHGMAQAERGEENKGFLLFYFISFPFILFCFEFRLKYYLPLSKVHSKYMHQQE
jgi:hypothetical protein